jgi:BirA family transcriptional regulator, biotin operon repressor / biotin---[acetyl-CoA-carboxylase] ligase
MTATDRASTPPYRSPLRQSAVADLLAGVPGPGGLPWRVQVAESVGSTNAEVCEAARAGAPEGLVIAADTQTAGRGRLGRTWAAPAGSALTFSVLLRPDGVASSAWSWLPLLVGVSVADGIRASSGVRVRLKWPNDLLVTGQRAGDHAYDRKLGGILVERPGASAAVVGVGVNVSLADTELPVPYAGSLLLAGAASLDREHLLVSCLASLAGCYDRWRDSAGDPARSGLRGAYSARCATLGRRVRVLLPAGDAIVGVADAIDSEGRLVVTGADGSRTVGAGDVLHVR